MEPPIADSQAMDLSADPITIPSEEADPRAAVQPEPPAVLGELKQHAIKKVAGGLPAVASSMHYAWEEMGVSRSAITLMRLNQNEGIDCTSCAWPDPDTERHVAEFCENGARAIADEATTHRITAEFFARQSVVDLSNQSDHWLNKQGRLTEPMVLRANATHYEPISWEDAFALIAAELRQVNTPNEAVFYTSGRTSNEAAFLYQLFVRQFGTNNLPDCSNMCHESTSVALSEAIGIGKGTVTLDDFTKADVIFLIGQNPGTNHPRMLSALQEAKRNGCTIIAANPLPETGLMRFSHPQEVGGMVGLSTELTDLFLQVRINGDMALLKGILKVLLEEEAANPGRVIDYPFIQAHTTGFADFVASLEPVGWESIVEQSGLTQAQIRQAAKLFANAERIITCWAMGLTQHKNGVGTIQEIVNLHLLRGQIGKPGAGLCPVRGHSNVQGDRTMGIWEKPKPEFLDQLAAEFNFTPPREHGYDTVAAIKAMHAGQVALFFALGGNFLSASPDTAYTAKALRRCRLTVQVSTKLNRAHLVTGRQALILPCLGRTEIDEQATGVQFVSTENSMGVVQRSYGQLAPGSPQLRTDVAIVPGVAHAVLGPQSTVDWLGLAANYDRIRDHIARVIPGFEEYNSRVRQRGGFYLPNAARDGKFTTASGRAHFTVQELPDHQLLPNQLVMMTIRSHDQFNTTIYDLNDRYRGIHNERRVVLLNAQDIASAGLAPGDIVDLFSHFAGTERVAHRFIVVAYPIPQGCAATYFPETNVLVPIESIADRSHTPTSKFVVITMRKAV
ncbi:MAG: FdhF/YdeP family oxidoreductase [Caldilineaceae bacterium]|nr:FdhF/YdeP family oxidoreductase [Caldilineaceae bacterium]